MAAHPIHLPLQTGIKTTQKGRARVATSFWHGNIEEFLIAEEP